VSGYKDFDRIATALEKIADTLTIGTVTIDPFGDQGHHPPSPISRLMRDIWDTRDEEKEAAKEPCGDEIETGQIPGQTTINDALRPVIPWPNK
jgi:hypothetical protein